MRIAITEVKGNSCLQFHEWLDNYDEGYWCGLFVPKHTIFHKNNQDDDPDPDSDERSNSSKGARFISQQKDGQRDLQLGQPIVRVGRSFHVFLVFWISNGNPDRGSKWRSQ
jgi:hypothetical protein